MAYYRPDGGCGQDLKNGDTWWLDILAISPSGDETQICPFTEGEWISAGDKSGKWPLEGAEDLEDDPEFWLVVKWCSNILIYGIMVHNMAQIGILPLISNALI